MAQAKPALVVACDFYRNMRDATRGQSPRRKVGAGESRFGAEPEKKHLIFNRVLGMPGIFTI
jgi:hypothetical protein